MVNTNCLSPGEDLTGASAFNAPAGRRAEQGVVHLLRLNILGCAVVLEDPEIILSASPNWVIALTVEAMKVWTFAKVGWFKPVRYQDPKPGTSFDGNPNLSTAS